jgi:hypothetical protein
MIAAGANDTLKAASARGAAVDRRRSEQPPHAILNRAPSICRRALETTKH